MLEIVSKDTNPLSLETRLERQHQIRRGGIYRWTGDARVKDKRTKMCDIKRTLPPQSEINESW